jgi:hypothetical protein
MWSYSPELHLCIVATVNMISVALTALGLIAVRLGSTNAPEDFQETPIVTFITIVVTVAVSILAVYIFCIVGIYKRKKMMLIPFLLLKSVLAVSFISMFLYLCIIKEKELVSLRTLYVGLSSLGSTVEVYFLMVGLMVYRDIYHPLVPSNTKQQINLKKTMHENTNSSHEEIGE